MQKKLELSELTDNYQALAAAVLDTAHRDAKYFGRRDEVVSFVRNWWCGFLCDLAQVDAGYYRKSIPSPCRRIIGAKRVSITKDGVTVVAASLRHASEITGDDQRAIRNLVGTGKVGKGGYVYGEVK